MSCNTQTNTINYLKKKELIEDNRNVPIDKREAFDAENERLTEYAKTDKGIDMGPLFTVENKEIKRSGKQGTVIINRANPNVKAFEAIEAFNEKSKKNNQTFEKRLEEQQESKIQYKEFLFDSTKKSIAPTNEYLPSEREQNRVDILNKLFDGTTNPTTANKFLKNLYSNGEIDINEEGMELIKSMLPTRSKIVFTTSDKMKVSKYSYAEYTIDNNTISINQDLMVKGNLYFAIESILHEIAHDRFHKALSQPKTNKQIAFRNSMVSSYEFYKRNLEIDPNNNDDYGFTNVDEFVSEILTNKAFRDKLKTAESTKSIWDSFIDAIKTLFGLGASLKVNEILDSIIDLAQTEYNENTESPLNKTFAKQVKTQSDIKVDLEKELTNVKGLLTRIYATLEAVKMKTATKEGEKYKGKYKDIQELLNDLKTASSKEAVLNFMEFSVRELNNLHKGILKQKNPDAGYLSRFKAYMSVFSNNQEIREILENLKAYGKISDAEYNKIDIALNQAVAKYNSIDQIITNKMKDVVTKIYAPHNKRVDTKYEELFKAEYKQNKPIGITESEYVKQQLDDNYDAIMAEKEKNIRIGLNMMNKDITSAEFALFTEKDIDNTFLSIMSERIDDLDKKVRMVGMNVRNKIATATKKANLQGRSSKSVHSFMLDLTKDNSYYVTKYKGKFNDKIESFQQRLSEEEFGSKKYKKIENERNKWIKENSKGGIPTSKWLNPKFNTMTNTQKEYYDTMIDQMKENNKKTNGNNSLFRQPIEDGPVFIKMHGITQSTSDKILSGEAGNAVKKGFGDLFKIRKDQDEFGQMEDESFYERTSTDLNNKAVNSIPIFYRGRIESNDQSFDVGTMVAMESIMAENYKQKKVMEAETDILLHVLATTKVQKRTTMMKALIGKFSKDEDVDSTVKEIGINTNIYKKIKSVVENRMYGITDVYAGKILGKNISVNKISNSIAGFTADLQLGLNWLTAIPNVVQAKLQNLIEGIGGDIYTIKDIKKAEQIYFADIKNIMDDVGSYTNKSKINILLETFDVMGDFSAVKNKFENRTKLRSLASKDSIHAYNAMGEHYAQSTLMLAIMNGVKVKNAKGQFIDSKGNVTTKDKAMSLYEAYEKKTDKDGNVTLELNKLADHTSHSSQKLSELGEIHHQQLIRKLTIKLHGQYDTKFQSHLQRSWYGKVFSMFKKWMVPAYQRRYKGVMYSLKDSSDLTDEQKFYDYEMGRFDEGIYTSFIRFIKNGFFPAVKNLNLELAKTNWSELSDMERSNIRKTIAELMITGMMITAAMLTYAAADDDDDELLFTLAYVFRRQQSEFMQFYHPAENLRVFRSPAVALNTVEKTFSWMQQIMPWAITEEYENGKNRGEYKSWIKTKKLIPIMAQFERSPKELFNFLENTTN